MIAISAKNLGDKPPGRIESVRFAVYQRRSNRCSVSDRFGSTDAIQYDERIKIAWLRTVCMESRLELDLNFAAIGDEHRDRFDLEFRIPTSPSAEDYIVRGFVTVRQWYLILQYEFGCFGCDLVRFAQSLRTLQQNPEGEARFENLDQSICVRFHYADVGRGWVETDVSLRQSATSPFTRRFSFHSLEFSGFGIEQTYLKVIANQIDDFLRESGVNLNDPFGQTY